LATSAKGVACSDWFAKEIGEKKPIGVIGWGEGGLVALYAGAIDPRIDAVLRERIFESRQQIWRSRPTVTCSGYWMNSAMQSCEHDRARKLVIEAARAPEANFSGASVRRPPGNSAAVQCSDRSRTREGPCERITTSGRH